MQSVFGAQTCSSAARTGWACRRTNQQRDKLWMESPLYPDYYKGGFHYQARTHVDNLVSGRFTQTSMHA